MTDWNTAAYYQRIARILEHGKFHLAFFDDATHQGEGIGGDAEIGEAGGEARGEETRGRGRRGGRVKLSKVGGPR